MNTLKLVMLGMVMLIISLPAVGQQSNTISLSDEQPQRGEKLTFTFMPEDPSKAYDASLYVFHSAGFNAADLQMDAAGAGYKGSFSLPDSATAVLISVAETGGDKKWGAAYQAYAEGKPVRGSYGAMAQVYNGMGEYFAGIDRDPAKSVEWVKREITHFPADENKHFAAYMGALVANKQVDEAKRLADERAAVAFADEASGESDLLNVANGYEYYLRDKSTADSLKHLIATRYPDGKQAASQDLAALRAEGDYAKKSTLFDNYIHTYSKQASSSLQPAYVAMAQAARQAKDYPKLDEYLTKIENKSSRASLLNQVAWPLAEAGEDLDYAAAKSKESLKLLADIIADPTDSKPASMTESQWKKNAEYGYRNNADTYALIRYKQGDIAEALDYQRKAVGEYNSAEVNERFVLFLKDSGKLDEAQAAAEKSIENGQSTETLKGYLKAIYSDKGHDDQEWGTYMAGLEERHLAEVRKKLIASIINEEAPQFSLVNMDGETVSSASLKGKVYVVDFWATWCGPCKASFPGMQLAVDKFKDRDDVAFLFVNTWENIPDREAKVKQFIADNQYSFNVLFDTVEGEGNDFDVVGAYGVSGIPTKFIVDKNGRIRFKAVGYSGSPEGELQKVSMMIELAANPPATTAAAME
ncbi:redoxin domain-containing protein [Parapedobacter sp.]